MAEQKYAVELPLPSGGNGNDAQQLDTFISPKKAGLIPRSVRLEITRMGKLPEAPSKELVEACLLLADISGFTALGEKLTKEHGDSLGAEKFAEAISAAIGSLVNVTHRYEGEVVKIAGDCLICTFSAIPSDPEDRGDEKSFERAKECALEMLKVIKQTNPDLDLHGGLAGSAPLQRIHLKELRGSSPRSNSARQRMKKYDQDTMSKAEFERSKQRWFCIAGRPIKIAAGLLDRAKAGTVKVYGGLVITRDTKSADILDEEENEEQMNRRMSKRGSMIDTYTSELSQCPEIASSYIPPIVRAKGGNAQFESEKRRVVVVFLSLPDLAKESITTKGVSEAHLNDVYSALRGVLAKFEGHMRDFLFEDKGCTLIACFGITQITEVDALRAVLFALEASSACSSLTDPCKIGISMGQCFTGICGHPSRNDFVVMGAETNMAARLMGKAEIGKILVSERVYNATQNYIGYDMSNPIEVKGKDGTFRALRPYGRRAGAVRHKNQDELDKGIFVGREDEMKQLRMGLKSLLEEKKGSAYILEGLAGMGKSAIVWQLQREAINENVRFLMGTGSAIEKQTPYFAFGQILTAAANLSTSPSYGEVLALKFNHQLEEEDINALGIILPTLAKRDANGQQLEHGRLEARAAQVCLKIFQSLENTIFVFEDAHWIDSQSWLMLQMVLPQLSIGSIVMIVTRPPNMVSQQKAGGADANLKDEDEILEDQWLEDDDRIKFSRILAALKENSAIMYLELGTMDNDTMRTLIAKTLDVQDIKVSDDFVQLMDRKAGGIPMYLSSMTNWLKERDMVNKDDDGNIFFNGDIAQIKFPSSIMDTVHERIDSLDEEAKVLIKVCSCFGFEFRLENLTKVAPQFLSSKTGSHLQSTLETLAQRGLVVAVTGESVSKMMKFTHQIITECAHNLMLDSQRRLVHRAIVEEYENSSIKFEMDVLAFHWLRSGEVDRGCNMLQNAAQKALKIGAYKEAINSLSQAIAYSKGSDSKRVVYWMALLSIARSNFGDLPTRTKLGWDAMHLLGDPSFLPVKKSKGSLEKMKREYEEMDDMPTKVADAYVFDDMDRAKVIIARIISDHASETNLLIKPNLLEQYGYKEDELIFVSEWYRYYALIHSFKQNDIDMWCQLHDNWAIINNGHLVQTDPAACRRIYRRLNILAATDRISPNCRVWATINPFAWYVVLAPEMVKNRLPFLERNLSLIDGNLKYSQITVIHFFTLAMALLSVGDVKMFQHYASRAENVRFDSEALPDQKAFGYEFGCVSKGIAAIVNGDSEDIHKYCNKLRNVPKLFSGVKVKLARGFTPRFMLVATCLEHDYDAAKTYAKQLVDQKYSPTLFFPFWTHVETFHSMIVWPFIALYEVEQKMDKPDPFYRTTLFRIRNEIKMFSTFNPGVFRCSMTAQAARITLALKDRPFKDVFKKLETALAYTIELECLPVDVLVLKCEIARWKGDVEMLSLTIEELEQMGHRYHVLLQNKILGKLKNGILKPVDLSFVPEKPVEKVVEFTDQEKMVQIEQAILDAKAEMAAAGATGDDETRAAARERAKALRKEKKALKKAIESKEGEGKIDQEKIDAVKAKIADAQARQNQAFDDEDDEAEEAAEAEITALTKELRALTGGVSIPKKKLEDAKQNAGFHMFVNIAKKKLQGQDVGFASKLKLKFENVGCVLFDGTSGVIDISTEDSEANATISMSLDTFGKIQSKELDFMSAMGEQLITIDGDMAVLMGGMPKIMKKMEEG